MSSQPGKPATLLNQRIDDIAIAQLAEEISELKRNKIDMEKPLQDLAEDLAKVEKRLSSIEKTEVSIGIALSMLCFGI